MEGHLLRPVYTLISKQLLENEEVADGLLCQAVEVRPGEVTTAEFHRSSPNPTSAASKTVN